MVMGLVGFLGVSYPRYPLLHPTYFHMPPLPSLWLNTFECVPIGTPQQVRPIGDTRIGTPEKQPRTGVPTGGTQKRQTYRV